MASIKKGMLDIAVKVARSWVAAISLLLGALLFRHSVPAAVCVGTVGVRKFSVRAARERAAAVFGKQRLRHFADPVSTAN